MIVLLGKNGSGKTYITERLEKMGLKKSVSWTTRAKRPKEVDGIDYVFVDRSEFEEKLKRGEMIEHKFFANNYYGTPIENMSTADIILSGSEISSNIMPFVDSIYYIDCPLTLRYEGMLRRKSPKEETFNRLHGENGEYLFNPQAKIFTNNYQADIIEEIYQSIQNKDLKKAQAFRDFLVQCVEQYKQSDHNQEKKSLQFLNFEEFILRKMYLEDRINPENYEEEIERFLINQHCLFTSKEDQFLIDFDGELTPCKKLVKKNENE